MMLDEQRRRLLSQKRRFERAWAVMTAKWPPQARAQVVAVQPEPNIYDQLVRLKEKHGMRSIKQAAYTALVIGLQDLQDVPAVPRGWK